MTYSCTQVTTACPFVKPRSAYASQNNTYIKSEPKEFRQWKIDHQDLFDRGIIVPLENNPRWGKIVLKNLGKSDSYVDDGEGEKIICLDPNSHAAGNIYNDYSVNALWSIHALSLLGRPFHATYHTLYHGTVGPVKAIYNDIKEKKSAKHIGLHAYQEFADVVRTPFYNGLLMTVQVASVFVTPCKPTFAYDCRAAIDRLTHELLWGNRNNKCENGEYCGGDLTPCQRRLANIMDFEKNGKDMLQSLQKLYFDDEEDLLHEKAAPLEALSQGTKRIPITVEILPTIGEGIK